LPIGFVGGIVSQLFLPFALTVTFALAASLVCALTVVPVLAYLFVDRVKLNVDADGEPRNSFWIRAYTPAIGAALRRQAVAPTRRWPPSGSCSRSTGSSSESSGERSATSSSRGNKPRTARLRLLQKIGSPSRLRFHPSPPLTFRP
jgi:hypothetical protein